MRGILLFSIISFYKIAFSQAYNPYHNYASISYGFYSKSFEKFVDYSETKEFKSRFYKIYDSHAELQGPISAKYEFNLTDELGIGPFVGYERINLTLMDSAGPAVNRIDLTLGNLTGAVRVNYHFNLRSKWVDLFIGGAFGANVYSFKKKTDPGVQAPGKAFPSGYRDKRFYVKSPVYAAATLGLRIYLNPRTGLNLEAGWEKGALLHAGLVFRFKEEPLTKKMENKI